MTLAHGAPPDGGGLAALAAPPAFSELPAHSVVRAFGVTYGYVRPPEGGDLYVTRYGWPHLHALLPAQWYVGERYAAGARLPGGSGHVYRYGSPKAGGGTLDLVVKFSRMAQDVPVVVDLAPPEMVTPEMIAEARFNSPMEEFGLVEELRARALASAGDRILTQQPLAIYAPPATYEEWELGRSASSFSFHRQLLADGLEPGHMPIEFDIRRIYVVLYRWIEGLDAQDCFERGDLPEDEFLALMPEVARQLAERGFQVLDNKPRHFILRRARGGAPGLLRRHGKLAYGLVDFELLQRTAAHQREYRSRRRAEYWDLLSRPPERSAIAAATAVQPARILGVDYQFGAATDGGELWVVGHEPRLFDYFIPDRWRRTRRVKLSPADEVYRTRTRDQIDMVYRRSRVGLRPRVDPLTSTGRRIRESGFNTPFEEVAIAERLRPLGVHTTMPRAIYRTAHESIKAAHLRDASRHRSHDAWRPPADLSAPAAHSVPALSLDHDYYTLWDTFRGAGPDAAGRVVAFDRAAEDGLVSREECEHRLVEARAQLKRGGLPGDSLEAEDFGLPLDASGMPRRNAGALELLLALDALSAYDYGLLPEREYIRLMRRTEARVRAADYELLDPQGRHLLLTLGADGCLRREDDGEPHAVLSNFSLVRNLYRASG